jgi:hypothetical protein
VTARPFGVIDADGHITDSEQKTCEYMEEPYRSRGNRLGQGGGGFDTHLGGILGSNARTRGRGSTRWTKGGWSARSCFRRADWDSAS